MTLRHPYRSLPFPATLPLPLSLSSTRLLSVTVHKLFSFPGIHLLTGLSERLCLRSKGTENPTRHRRGSSGHTSWYLLDSWLGPGAFREYSSSIQRPKTGLIAKQLQKTIISLARPGHWFRKLLCQVVRGILVVGELAVANLLFRCEVEIRD